MTSVEKRRSGRKSGKHRKHSDGGYSDTSSGGSFPDETDREVCNLTDRAFRSLCIGDEAVYNDSDLCSSSPCTQIDRQLAFSQSGQQRGEDIAREELKRNAHDYNLRMQQYGQDWMHGGTYGAEIQRDPQWEVYGARTQGRVSATFQHSFVETAQQEEFLGEEQLSFLSNGATELSSQQRRSRSRVSSLIRAFNSEGQRDGAGMDGRFREWNDQTSWDKSALMSIERELSEFSTSYQQTFNSGHFPSAGPFSSRDTNFYSSEIASVANLNSASSFMRSSHSKHSMSTEINCNSNFFIHSEFSPFKVWRGHNRFPFQQDEVSGFMQRSEFPRWYETPMYRDLSLEDQPKDPYQFINRGVNQPKNTLAPAVPPTLPRSTSTSTMLQKASAVEKRCESELTGHYPHRKRTQSLGTSRFTAQRPSTASPTSEMSRRVQDTISSVKALQQKIKMMTEQNIATGMAANQQGIIYSNDNSTPFSNNGQIVAPNLVNNNTRSTPFNISQLLTPLLPPHQEPETPEVQQYAVSPQPVEHPPVRAESRGATPDVRMSSYRSRASNLLFNLKDNRKRVKSTYSPAKFKGLETLDKNNQPSSQEPRDTVIDIPDFPDQDVQFLQVEESSRTNGASYQYVNQYHSPGLSLTPNSQSGHTGQYSEYASSNYQTAQMQSEMVHQSGFTGFIPGIYTSHQPANGQNLNQDLSSFTHCKQSMTDNVETLGGNLNGLKTSYTSSEMSRHADNNQSREYVPSKANAKQHFNETEEREFTKVDRYQQLKDNKHDYSNASSQDSWKQTYSQETEKKCVNAASTWKQEISASMEKDQHAQAYERATSIKEELSPQREKYTGENLQTMNKGLEKKTLRERVDVERNSHKKAGLMNPTLSNQLPPNDPLNNDTTENPSHYGQRQAGAFKDKYIHQRYYGHNKENETKDNYVMKNDRYTDQEYSNQQAMYSNKDKSIIQETYQRKQPTPIPKVYEIQSLRQIEAKHPEEENPLFNPENAFAPTMANLVEDRKFVEVKNEQDMAEQIKAQQAQHWAQVEQPKAESARLILAGQAGLEKVKPEQAKTELTEQEKLNQVKAEHIQEKERKQEWTDHSREKHPQCTREEQTKSEHTRGPQNIIAVEGVEHLQKQQGEQVKAKQAEAEKLKEEHIKTEMAKTEQVGQARLQHAKTEQARREEVKAEHIKEEQVRVKQVQREQIEAEQIREEKVKAEQAEAECRKSEEAQLKQLHEQQAQAVQEKTKVNEVGKFKATHNQVEDIKQEKAEEDSIQASFMNAKQPAKITEKKTVQTMFEQTKLDLVKTETITERSAKPTATVTQHTNNEPDKVEQVKTELAKAKAELAKIKEKMKDQKEKVKNVFLTKEDGIKTEYPPKLNNKCEEFKNQDQETEMHQQGENTVVVSRQYSEKAKVNDEYERLREKYGFVDKTAPNKNKLSAAGNVSSNEANETPVVSFGKAETTNHEKSKDNSDSASRAINTNKKDKVDNFKATEFIESQYVYSESSKEFKLSGGNSLPVTVDRNVANDKTVKVKDEKLEKPEKLADISQQRDSDLAKMRPLERSPKSTEKSAAPNREHFIPPRVLSSKERAQTKQEILTSKIKAHAEKEISAIKEKGFAVRDGFISKNSTKLSAGSQSNNIRQRPPSQEMSKKHESTMSSKITPKQQMEHSEIQTEPVKSVLPPSSAPIPAMPATTNSQVENLRNQVPKEPLKNKDNVPELPREAKQTGSYTTSTNEGWVGNQKKGNQYDMNLPIESKEQATTNKQGKKAADQGESSGNRQVKDNPAMNSDNLNKMQEDPSQGTDLLEAESSKPMLTKKAESKHEEVHEESAPSLHLVFGQNKIPVADDSLQIAGIIVTVRERKPSMDNSESNNSTQEEINEKETESLRISGSGLEVSKENTSSKVESNDAVVANTHSTVKEDQNKVGMNNHPENMQENSTQDHTRCDNVSENITVEQESSSINARPQRVTQLQELSAEKGVSTTVTAPAKNKVLNETQPLLYKQDITVSEKKDYTNETPKENSVKSLGKDEIQSTTEEKNPPKRQIATTNENMMANEVKSIISSTMNSKRVDAETLVNHDIQLSAKNPNPSKSRNMDDRSAAPLEKKISDLTPPKPFSKTSPSNLIVNENKNVTQKLQYNETHFGGINEVDDNVHIDSIAIRVLPAVTEKNNLKRAGKLHVPSDEVTAHEQKQVASSILEDKASSLNDEDITKELAPASSEKKVKDSFKDELRAQCVSSSMGNMSDLLKIHNKQDSLNASSETMQAGNEKPEKVNKSEKSVEESNIASMVGDYFQVQGAVETNNEPLNCTNIGPMSIFPGTLPNKAAISSELCNEEKNEAFVLDQSIMKTLVSSSIRKNRETEDNLASNQTDGSTESQRNKNEKTEAGRAIHMRKHHTENQSSLSARERVSSRNSNSTKEQLEVKPKPKERVFAIPEISAIADYARLKVIVSEDEANTIQEFPPNKKEGFFPLIQTRHSRRPVFTSDPQDLSVKEKRLPNKTEVSSKVNKEPKPLVFPITEKEHQRTGMFKLGDKEKQEKILVDAKVNEAAVDTKVKHAPHLKEINKLQLTHLKSQGSEERVGGADTQKVCQVEQNATTSSSTVDRPSVHHLNSLDKSNLREKTLKQVYNIEESTATPRKDEKIENTKAKFGEMRTVKTTQERLVTQQEETKAQQQREAKLFEEKQASRTEEEKRAEDMTVKHMIEQNRASLAEEERRAFQREEERRAREREAITIKIKERREKQREAERRAEEERAAQNEEEMRAKQREDRRVKESEEKRRLKIEQEHRAKLREEEEWIKENAGRREKQQEDERAAQEEQKRRAAQEERQRSSLHEQEKTRVTQEELQRRDAQEEQQRRAAQEEQQKRAEDQHRRAAQEEQQRRAAQEEQQRRAAQEEQQRRAAQEEQQRRAAQEEQQRRAAQEEQQRRAEDQQKRAVQEEQQRRAAQEEQQRRAAQEEQQRRAAQEEQQRRATQEEQQRRATHEDKQRRAAQEDQQRRAAQEEQQRIAAQEEQQRRAEQEEQQRKAAPIEEQRRAKQIKEEILADIEEKRKIKQKEEQQAARMSAEERIKQIQGQKMEEQKREEWMRTQTGESEWRAVEKETTIIKQKEDKQDKGERIRFLEESQAALKEKEKGVAQDLMLAQREDEIRAKKREEKLADHTQMEAQKRAAQRMDALQYYAITSTESERKPRERLSSPLPSQQRPHQSGNVSTEDSASHTRLYRTHGPASPAPSLPRSNTSSPALGAKPLMFRVKDNTMRGSSFTKSVKPRFHKNFVEDFRMGSPMERGSERGEEEHEIMRRSAGTPVYPDTGLNRLAGIKETSILQPAYSSHDYSAPLSQHRPYSRRSIVLDEDDSRSILSNMSEDVESFATSAADLADIRALYDYDRPESACSFSSDVSRSLGKPPTVPPKSEKALRRAKRLTTRRIKKELSKTATDSSAGVGKSLQEVTSSPSSYSNEVCSFSCQAVASPHFSSPVSLAHAPPLESNLSSSYTKHQSSHNTFYASPHATGPISLTVASPHATAPISLPVTSPNATGVASNTAAPKIISHVPSSPTLQHVNHQAPVAQYHVDSNYPHSYPMTQRKVLQDLGSGQYFVVDVPVQVKTKTFFDPETGKYVQLNVRQSGQGISQPQQMFPQPQLQPQMQVKLQQQHQAPPASKPFLLYQGSHGYPPNYQPPAINTAPCHSLSGPLTLHQDQQPAMESHDGYLAPEIEHNSEGHRYSPEKTPYMDTVNDKDKTYNQVSQLTGGSVCENDSSVLSQCQPRDIITMSELEDFMEVSDW